MLSKALKILRVQMSANLFHVLCRLYVVAVYKVNVLKLQPLETLMNAASDSVRTEVLVFARLVLPYLSGNKYLFSR